MSKPVITPSTAVEMLQQAFPQVVGTTMLVQDPEGRTPTDPNYETTEVTEAVTEIDTTSLRLFQNAYDDLSSNSNALAKFKTDLLTVVGQYYFVNKTYTGMGFSIVRTYEGERGTILQKIKTSMNNNSNMHDSTVIFDLTTGVSPDLSYQDFELSAKYFNQPTTKQLKVSVSDKVWRGLFNSKSSVLRMMNTIMSDIDRELKIHEDIVTRMLMAVAIAEVYNKGGIQKINLVQEYLELTGVQATRESLLYDAGFHTYMVSRIDQVRSLLKDYNGLFNFDNYPMETRDSNSYFVMNSYVVDKAGPYLLTDKFNEQYVKLSGYTSLLKWQGTGSAGDFEDVTRVNIKYVDSTGTEVSFNKDGIIGFICNEDALAIYDVEYMDDSEKIAGKFATNYYPTYLAQTLIDLDEDFVIFTMEDYTLPEGYVAKQTPLAYAEEQGLTDYSEYLKSISESLDSGFDKVVSAIETQTETLKPKEEVTEEPKEEVKE